MEEPTKRLPIFRTLLVGFGLILIYGLLKAIVRAQDVFLLGFIGILIATVFSFPVRIMARWISRGWAVVVTLILLLLGIAGLVWSTVPIISEQFTQLADQGPKAYNQLEQWLTRAGKKGTLSQIPNGNQIAESAKDQIHDEVGKLLPKTIPVAVQGLSVVSGLFLLIILGAFLAHQPEDYLESLKTLVPRKSERHLVEVWRRLGIGLRHWMGGIVVSMTIMGAVAALGLWLVGIPGWFTLGLVTFFGTFVPYAGAIVSAIPGLIVGLADSETKFLYVLLVYLVVHIVEGYMIQPLVMRKAVSLQPGLLLFWQMLMTALFGLLGIVVATPLLVCVKVIVGYFHIERNLGKEGPEP